MWILAACLAPPHACRGAARALLGLGCALGIVACLTALPDGTPVRSLPVELAGQPVAFGMEPAGLWLMGFGLVPAAFACWLGSPLSGRSGRWHAGAAFSLLGALGVFGLQDGAALLAAWESMSLGGALMLSPGFVTDVFGVLLVLPFTRPVFRRLLTSYAAGRVTTYATNRVGGDVIRGDVVDDQR